MEIKADQKLGSTEALLRVLGYYHS